MKSENIPDDDRLEKPVVFYQNPAIDVLFGFMDEVIPSKKEDFKPVEVIGVFEDGSQKVLNDMYQKKPSSQSVANFEALIRHKLKDFGIKFLRPAVLEVFVGLTVPKEKIFDFDLDNIAKTVLDSLKGLLYEDDSQVIQLICKKDVHPMNTPGFWVAVTELKEGRVGLLGDVILYFGGSEINDGITDTMPI